MVGTVAKYQCKCLQQDSFLSSERLQKGKIGKSKINVTGRFKDVIPVWQPTCPLRLFLQVCTQLASKGWKMVFQLNFG